MFIYEYYIIIKGYILKKFNMVFEGLVLVIFWDKVRVLVLGVIYYRGFW